jgi:hypothetical protein
VRPDEQRSRREEVALHRELRGPGIARRQRRDDPGVILLDRPPALRVAPASATDGALAAADRAAPA